MTETTAGLALGAEAPDLASADARLRLALLARQRPLFGVDTRIEQKEDSQSGMDGRPQGQLLCRGHYVASGYFRDDAASKAAITDDGWLRTGDVVATDAYGRIEVVDRAKDLIKSGGEWISSAELESQASLLSGVAEAAVIGIPHPKWEERPLLLVRCQAGSAIEPGAIIEQLRDLVPRWWMPEVCKIVDEIPKTATGKVDKKAIRANYSGWSYDAAGHLVRPHD